MRKGSHPLPCYSIALQQHYRQSSLQIVVIAFFHLRETELELWIVSSSQTQHFSLHPSHPLVQVLLLVPLSCSSYLNKFGCVEEKNTFSSFTLSLLLTSLCPGSIGNGYNGGLILAVISIYIRGQPKAKRIHLAFACCMRRAGKRILIQDTHYRSTYTSQ